MAIDPLKLLLLKRDWKNRPLVDKNHYIFHPDIRHFLYDIDLGVFLILVKESREVGWVRRVTAHKGLIVLF